MENSVNYELVYDKALKLLSLREHTIFELRRKLTLRKYPKDLIDQVLTQLVELKFIDDERFARIYLDNLIRYKSFGYYGLLAKLLQRGVADSVAKKLLEENLSSDQELIIAQKIAAKKSSDKLKLINALKSKGFRTNIISEITKGI